MGEFFYSYLPLTSVLIDNGCQNEIWRAANEKEVVDIIPRLLWPSPAAALFAVSNAFYMLFFG